MNCPKFKAVRENHYVIHAKYAFITDGTVMGSWRFDKMAFLAPSSNFWQRTGL